MTRIMAAQQGVAPSTSHGLTAVTIMFLLTLAGMLDYLGIGADNWRDKLAFLIALPAIWAGWDGSALDHGLTENIRQAISAGLEATGPTLGTAEMANAGVTCFVFAVLLYTLGCLAPDRWKGKLGRVATWSMSGKGSALKRMNPRVWIPAIVLGLMSEMLGGLSGALLHSALGLLASVTAGLPSVLVGL
jgi:hypothetical protein